MTNLIFSKALLPILGGMLIQGSSIPFPGLVVLLAFGSTMRPSFKDTVVIAALMAICYTVASFIPYAIGRKFGIKALSIFDKNTRIKASIDKTKRIVSKYGIVSISISRFWGWGSKVSYIAGISKIKYLPYGLLTFSGVYTWAIVILNVGKVFEGNTNIIIEVLEKYTVYLYIVVAVVSVIYILIALFRYRMKCKS